MQPLQGGVVRCDLDIQCVLRWRTRNTAWLNQRFHVRSGRIPYVPHPCTADAGIGRTHPLLRSAQDARWARNSCRTYNLTTST
jgi:hypothetical protein